MDSLKIQMCYRKIPASASRRRDCLRERTTPYLDEHTSTKHGRHLSDKVGVRAYLCLEKAKAWLKEKARGSERYGIVCSSQAYRLKPLAIDVRVNPDHVHWFLDDENDATFSISNNFKSNTF